MVGRRLVMLPLVLLACAVAWGSEQTESPTPPVQELAVLEDVPSDTVSPDGKPTYTKQVRLAFYYDGKHWRSRRVDVDNRADLAQAHLKFAGPRAWTAVKRNKPVGHVDSDTHSPYDSYCSVGLQRITTAPEKLPDMGPRGKAFSGWMPYPVSKPMVLVSRDWLADPEKWTREPPPDHVPAVVGNAFRLDVRVRVYQDEEWVTLPPLTVSADNQLRVSESWRSEDDSQLVCVEFVEGNPAYSEDSDVAPQGHWFGIRRGEEPLYLGGGMALIDFGDFDNDGECEFIFFIDDYNRNGYRLVSDDFAASVEICWGYH